MLNLKLAWRQLRKDRLFTFINMIGLTVGMTAALALFLYVQKENSFDRYHENTDRIARVNLAVDFGGTQGKWANAPNITGPALVEELPEAEQFVRWLHHNFGRTAFIAHEEQRLAEDRLFWADSTLFEVFDLPLVHGDAATALDRPETVVLSESFSRKLFGERNPVGEVIEVDNTHQMEVTGVYRDFPDESSMQAALIGSLSSLGWAYDRLYWGNASFETFILFQEGSQIAGLAPKLQRVIDGAIEKEEQWFSLELQPLADIHLHSQEYAESYTAQLGDHQQVRLIGFLALAVLLLACFNYINLTTARSQQRLREVGISKVLGAGTGQMVARFLAETAVLAGLSIILATGLLVLLMPSISQLTDRDINLGQLLANGRWLVLPVTWLAVTLIAGIYPALALGWSSPKQLLSKPVVRQSRSGYFRQALVVGQFVVCIALIAGALLCQQQINFIGKKNLGYQGDAVIAVNLAGTKEESRRSSLEEAFAQQGQVESVARVQAFPGIGTSGYSMTDPENDEISYSIHTNHIAAGGEEILGLELLAGKFLPHKGEGDTTIQLVMNETAVSLMGWTPEEAIGKIPDGLFGDPATIVGVVRDFHYESLHRPVGAYALHNAEKQGRMPYLLVKLKSTEMASVIPRLADIFQSHLPESAFDYSFLDQTMAELYRSEARLSTVVWVFTLLTIFISVLGLLGLASFAAARRTKEISIRKVLGASVTGIVLLLSRDFARLIALAFLLAIPLSWWAMQNWLENFAYRIDPQWWVFALAGGLALLVAFATIAGQSWRAARVNPANTLRGE